MKFTIDTTQKLITITERVSLKDLNETLKTIFGDSFEEYSVTFEAPMMQIPYTEPYRPSPPWPLKDNPWDVTYFTTCQGLSIPSPYDPYKVLSGKATKITYENSIN